jgi:hypothetical protein
MALTIQTTEPQALLSSIKTAINAGHVQTWMYDEDGDSTHSPEQWAYKAWLRPIVKSGALRLVILGSTKTKMSKAVYGVYHGRFTEMVLTHCDTQCTAIEASALAAPDDQIG